LRLRVPDVFEVELYLNSTSPSQFDGAPGARNGAPLMCAVPVTPSGLRWMLVMLALMSPLTVMPHIADVVMGAWVRRALRSER